MSSCITLLLMLAGQPAEAAPGPAEALPVVPTGIFGGAPRDDGGEDSRIPLGSDDWWRLRMGDWSLGGGTIHCDGRQRGSAVILATEDFGPAPSGQVLATAAHVLYDLESGLPFGHCRFHYMGLSQLPGYQADIDLATASLGQFDPDQPADSVRFGKQDWAFLHVPERMPAVTDGARLKPVAWEDFSSDPDAGNSGHLLAWSVKHSAISVSLDCQFVASRPGDLGGGAWPGQLLDDCDSGQGASGGGLLGAMGQEFVLVGIRTGSHWNPSTYPADLFPSGPPPGAKWDIRNNTNFSRAIDHELLVALGQFLIRLDGARKRPVVAFAY